MLLAVPVLAPGWGRLRELSWAKRSALIGVRLSMLAGIGVALLLAGWLVTVAGWEFRFDDPWWLALLALAIPIVLLGRLSLATLEPYRRWTAMALRLIALALLAFMLAGLQAVQTHHDLTVIAVVDQSESVRRFFQPPQPPGDDPAQHQHTARSTEQWVRQYLQRATRDRGVTDKFGMVTFDGQPRVRAMPDEMLTLDPGTIQQPHEGSDHASALRTATALFPENSGTRLVLVADGNDTGDPTALLEAAREARAKGIAVDVLPLEYEVDNEVMVEALHAPIQRGGVQRRGARRASRHGAGLGHASTAAR